MRRSAVAVCALLAVGWPGHAPAQGGQDAEQRLDKLRRQIDERETRAREYSDEAEGYLGELEEIDQELTATRAELKQLRRRQRMARRELSRAEAEVAEVDETLARAREQVAGRLVALYKFRAAGGYTALYSARDFQRVARRGRGLEHVLESDGKLFESYRELRGERNAALETRAAVVSKLARARGEVDAREEEVRQKLVERRNVVALLNSRADRERRAAGELREAARRLEETLERLPSGGQSAGPGLVRGRVSWPVRGVLRLGFGRQVDPEFGTTTLRNGIEIAALEGSPVRAVAPGRVLFAGWFRGYGQMVIVDHGQGHMTVSGFLEELASHADQYVRADQVIGAVGETGSLTGPGLYFEIRDGGQAVDPGAWLE